MRTLRQPWKYHMHHNFAYSYGELYAEVGYAYSSCLIVSWAVCGGIELSCKRTELYAYLQRWFHFVDDLDHTTVLAENRSMSRHIRFWYLWYCPSTKAQASLCACASSAEPSLFTCTKKRCRWRLRPKLRHLAKLIVSAISIVAFLWDIGKRCWPRLYYTQYGVWSGSHCLPKI